MFKMLHSDLEHSGSLASTPKPTRARLIPHIVDERASSTPNRVMYQSPRSSDPKDGWESVTWAQFANAVNHTTRWLTDTLGGSAGKEGEFPTVAYIGPNDARYSILVIAAVKAGYKVSRRRSSTLGASPIIYIQASIDFQLYEGALHLPTQYRRGPTESLRSNRM